MPLTRTSISSSLNALHARAERTILITRLPSALFEISQKLTLIASATRYGRSIVWHYYIFYKHDSSHGGEREQYSSALIRLAGETKPKLLIWALDEQSGTKPSCSRPVIINEIKGD